MASCIKEVERIVGLLTEVGDISARKMFGEYGIYCSKKMIAMICDDRLFVKRTEEGYLFWGEHEEASPYPGAKPCMVLGERDFRDRWKLAELMRITYAHLPEPAAKKKAKK